MTVSGKRAGVEFQQTIQTPLVNIQESGLPAMVVGPFYQFIDGIVADSANPDAVAKNASGDVLLYDGEKLVGADDATGAPLVINFWADPENRTGAIAVPLIDKSLILPNERALGAVASDPFFKVFLNTVGTDEFVELNGPGTGPNFDYDLVTFAGAPGNAVNGETVGIELKPGLTDSTGSPFSSLKKAQVVISMRALRRDYSRSVLKVDADTFATIAGDTFGPENPAAFALQKVFEADSESFAYLVAIDEVTDAEPDGTYSAYIRGLSEAETVDVYTIFVPTTDRSILNAVKNHVLEQSKPEGRHERIGLVSTGLPTQGPDEVKASGVGDLKPVAPTVAYAPGDSPAQVEVHGELVQAGASLNNKVTLELVQPTASTNTIQYAGRQLLNATGYTGATAAAGGSIVTISADITADNVDPNNGDLLRYTLTEGTITVDAAEQTIKDANRNFKELGLAVNDRIEIPTAGSGTRFAVTRILTTDTINDTIEVAPVGHSDPITVAESVSYDATVDVLITDVVEAATSLVTTSAVFDAGAAADINTKIDLVSGSDYTIVVAQGDTAPDQDSWELVSLLNSDIDVQQIAEFYVGTGAVRGVDTEPTGGYPLLLTFAGGSDEYRQFYTNADISGLNQATTHFLDLASENRDPEIIEWREWNGSVVVSDPGGSANPDLTGLKVNESYSIYIEGAPLVLTTPLGTENDLQAQAETLALFPERFRSRRIRAIWPDKAFTEVAGTAIEAPGYYLGATLAGLISSLFPEQGHSELPIPGWDRLENSNDYFKEAQLEIMTAAGWWVYVQDNTDGPIVCRKQYTTDTSGDITAEASFTTIADNFQKDVRNAVRPLLGVNNLTPDLIDRVRLLIQSVGKRYENRQAIKSYTLNSLEPSKEPGDLTTLVGDITLEFYGPFNLLRIRVNL